MTIKENDLRLERVRQVTARKLERIKQLEAEISGLPQSVEIKELQHSLAELQFIWGKDVATSAVAEKRQKAAKKKAEQRQESKQLREVALARIASEQREKKSTPVNHRALNSSAPNWTPNEDEKILEFIAAKGPLAVTEVALALEPKLKGRTHGAIAQRLRKVPGVQLRKDTSNERGGVPRLIAEAA